MNKVAIIVALEREIAPLLKDPRWQAVDLISEGSARRVSARQDDPVYRNYESEQGLIMCAGIGATAARAAAEKLIPCFRPTVLISAGLAGGLTPHWKAGDVIFPATIVQAPAGAVLQTGLLPEAAGIKRSGVLVSTPSIAGAGIKSLLARQFQADAVDMEAGAVAEIAAAHGIPFVAVKAISDEYDFPVPDLGRFVDPQGRFLTGRFLLHAAVRPRTWPAVGKLASNTKKASQELCRVLRILVEAINAKSGAETQDDNGSGECVICRRRAGNED